MPHAGPESLCRQIPFGFSAEAVTNAIMFMTTAAVPVYLGSSRSAVRFMTPVVIPYPSVQVQ